MLLAVMLGRCIDQWSVTGRTMLMGVGSGIHGGIVIDVMPGGMIHRWSLTCRSLVVCSRSGIDHPRLMTIPMVVDLCWWRIGKPIVMTGVVRRLGCDILKVVIWVMIEGRLGKSLIVAMRLEVLAATMLHGSELRRGKLLGRSKPATSQSEPSAAMVRRSLPAAMMGTVMLGIDVIASHNSNPTGEHQSTANLHSHWILIENELFTVS